MVQQTVTPPPGFELDDKYIPASASPAIKPPPGFELDHGYTPASVAPPEIDFTKQMPSPAGSTATDITNAQRAAAGLPPEQPTKPVPFIPDRQSPKPTDRWLKSQADPLQNLPPAHTSIISSRAPIGQDVPQGDTAYPGLFRSQTPAGTAAQAAGVPVAPVTGRPTAPTSTGFTTNPRTGQRISMPAVPEAEMPFYDPARALTTGPEQIVGGGRDILEAEKQTATSPNAYYTNPRTGQRIPMTTLPETAQRREMHGAAQVLGGVGDVSLPLVAASAATAPLKTAAGFGAGYLASEGAGVAVHGHVSPEAEELTRQVSFFLPAALGTVAGLRSSGFREVPGAPGARAAGGTIFGGRAGAMVGETPSMYTGRVKVGPFKGEINIPKPGRSLGSTGGAEPAPQAPPMSDAEAALVRHAQSRGDIPPVVPQTPEITPAQQVGPRLSGKAIDVLTQTIAQADPEERNMLIDHAHQRMTEWISANNGRVVVDGQVHLAKNPAAAEALAQKIINDSITKHDKAAADAQAAQAEQIAAAPAPRTPTVQHQDLHPDTIDQITQEIASKPPAEQPQAILDEHQRLMQAIVEAGGRYVTTNGKGHLQKYTVDHTDPAAVEKAADEIVSNAEQRYQSGLAEQQKAAEAAAKNQAASAGAPSQSRVSAPQEPTRGAIEQPGGATSATTANPTPIEGQYPEVHANLAGGAESATPQSAVATLGQKTRQQLAIAGTKPGEPLYSRSGRILSRTPNAGGYDAWLVKEAKAEHAANPKIASMIDRANPKKLSERDRAALNDLVFGNQDGPGPANRVARTMAPEPAVKSAPIVDVSREAHANQRMNVAPEPATSETKSAITETEAPIPEAIKPDQPQLEHAAKSLALNEERPWASLLKKEFGPLDDAETRLAFNPALPHSTAENLRYILDSIRDKRRTAEAPATRSPERRQDAAARKRVAEMTPEERSSALLTSEKTGLPNLRAFQEDAQIMGESHPHVGYADLDDFKKMNTALGHEGVDTAVLPAVGDIFQRAIAKEPGGSVKVYRRSGDEFLFRSNDPARVKRVVERVNKELAETTFTYQAPDGNILEKKGAGLSHGVGKSPDSAEAAADLDKQSRKAAGLRTGERDVPAVAEGSSAGEQAAEGGAAGREGVSGEEGVEPKPVHKFGSTQINIDPQSDLGKLHAAAVEAIPEDHLGKEGRERTPHVTVRYGLKDDSPESIARIKEAVARIPAFEVPVGKTDIFPASEHSSGDNPVIAKLEKTPELLKLREAVEGAGGFKEDSFPSYEPHVSLAYVRPEFADQYKGGTQLEGQKVPVSEIAVSKRDGTTETLPLAGAESPTMKTQTDLIKSRTKVAPPNSVFREVFDRDGNRLGLMVEKHDGTEQGISDGSQILDNKMYHDYPDASGINSRTGATDETGKPKWVISPNGKNIAEAGTPESRYILGDTSANPENTEPSIDVPAYQRALDASAKLDALSAQTINHFIAERDGEPGQYKAGDSLSGSDRHDIEGMLEAEDFQPPTSTRSTSGKGEFAHPTKPPEKVMPAPVKKLNAGDMSKGEILSPEAASQRIESWKAEAKRIGETQDNSNKVVISLFDRTGRWSQPYRDAGYDVRTYDIKNGDDLVRFLPVADIAEIRDSGKEIIGVLAAPPCTSYAVSGARWWVDQHDAPNAEMVAKKYGDWASKYFDTPLDYANTLVAATQVVVELANPTEFHAMENPIGRIASQNDLPQPLLTFDPHSYGSPYTKKTQLWGDFNPNLPTANVEPTEGSKMHKLRGDDEYQKLQRSETPEGFAYAFFMANHGQSPKTASATDTIKPEAGLAQTAERGPSKLDVAGSTPASRSNPFTAKAEISLAEAKSAKNKADRMRAYGDGKFWKAQAERFDRGEIDERGKKIVAAPQLQGIPKPLNPGDSITTNDGRSGKVIGTYAPGARSVKVEIDGKAEVVPARNIVTPETPKETAPATPKYRADNPFAERAIRYRKQYEDLSRPSAHDQAMAQSFPLGGGYGGGRAAGKRLDATINNAVKAQEALKNARYYESSAEAFDRGLINAQGRRITPESQARGEKREAYQMGREERVNAAKAAMVGKEKWEVPAETYADSTNNLGGGARKLVLSGHREAVEQVLAAGKYVPPEVLADYPDLKPKEESAPAKTARQQMVENWQAKHGKKAKLAPEPVSTVKQEEPTPAESPAIKQFDQAIEHTGAKVKTGQPSPEFAKKIAAATTLEPADDAALKEKFKGAAYQREYFKGALEPAMGAWKVHLSPADLQKALKSADVDVTRKSVAVDTKGKTTYAPNFPPGQETPHLYVKVPGDGHFLINNNPYAIAKALKGADRGFAKFNPLTFRKSEPIPSGKPSEAARQSYINRMVDEISNAGTPEEKQAARDNLENIQGFRPPQGAPGIGDIVENNGERHIVIASGTDRDPFAGIVPESSDLGKDIVSWDAAGRPKDDARMSRARIEDGTERASWYTLNKVGELGKPELSSGQGPASPTPEPESPSFSEMPPEEINTPKFKRWFSGSKVIDAEGKPLLAYHGTDRPFTDVDMSKGAQGVFWLTTDKSSIETGKSGAVSSAHILKAYVSLKNPAGWPEYEKKSLGELKRDGYDGVMLKSGDHHDIIVFKPTQVRFVNEWKEPISFAHEPTGWQTAEPGPAPDNRLRSTYQPPTETEPPILTISPGAARLIATVGGHPQFRGAHAEAAWASQLAAKLWTKSDEYDEQGITQLRDDTAELAGALSRAAKAAGSGGVIAVREGAPGFTYNEERFHSAQGEIGEGSTQQHLETARAEKLLRPHPVVAYFEKQFADSKAYRNLNPVAKATEIAAKLVTHQHKVSAADRADWFNKYVDELEAQHGPEKVAGAFNKLYDSARELYANAKTANAGREAGAISGRSREGEAGIRPVAEGAPVSATGPPEESGGVGTPEDGGRAAQEGAVEQPAFSEEPDKKSWSPLRFIKKLILPKEAAESINSSQPIVRVSDGDAAWLAKTKQLEHLFKDGGFVQGEWGGSSLSGAQIERMANEIGAMGQRALSDKLMDAAKRAGVRGVVLVHEGSPKHVEEEELFHGAQRELGKGGIAHLPKSAMDRLLSHPVAQFIMSDLDSNAYDSKNPWIAVAEIAAKIATGTDFSDIDEAADWLDKYFQELHDYHGLDRTGQVFETLPSRAKEFYREARRKQESELAARRPGGGGRAGETGQDVGQFPAREAQAGAKSRDSGYQEPRVKGLQKTLGPKVPPGREGESGFAKTNIISTLAGAVRDFLVEQKPETKIARGFDDKLFELGKQQEADALRMLQLMKEVAPHTTPEDQAQIFRSYEPRTNATLTPEQEQFKEQVVQPIKDKDAQLRAELNGEGIPVGDETGFIHREVKDKGGVLERASRNLPGSGKGNILSTSASSLKRREMFALIDPAGKATVIKDDGRRIVSFENGKAKDLGPSSNVATAADRMGRATASAQADIDAATERINAIPEEDRKAQIKTFDQQIKNLERQKSLLGTVKGRVIGQESVHGIEPTFGQRAKLTEAIDKLTRRRDDVANDQTNGFMSSKAQAEFKREQNNLKAAQLHLAAAKDAYGKYNPQDEIFRDKNGKDWKYEEANSDEITQHAGIKYHQNALASVVSDYLQLSRAKRAVDALNEMKESPEFKAVSFKSENGSLPPDGWQRVSGDLPMFRDYHFEPRTAEVLDRFAKEMHVDPESAIDKIGHFMTATLMLNPIRHIYNIGNHWLVERGVAGTFNPLTYPTALKAGIRAIRAVVMQNNDFLQALDEGAPMMSHRADLRELNKTIYNLMLGHLEEHPAILDQLAEFTGISRKDAGDIGAWNALKRATGLRLLNNLRMLGNKAMWMSNDIFMLQSAYEKMEKGSKRQADGSIVYPPSAPDFKTAMKQVAKHIPDYRIPPRVMDSPKLAKVMSSPLATVFSRYHYGVWRSYMEMARETLGKDSTPAERLNGLNHMLMLGLLTFVGYKLFDEALKHITGDKDARMVRSGASAVPYNISEMAKGHKTPEELIQGTFTPAMFPKFAAELAMNRDLYSGSRIYDRHDTAGHIAQDIGGHFASTLGPIQQAEQASRQEHPKRNFIFNQAGVTFPKAESQSDALRLLHEYMRENSTMSPDTKRHMDEMRAAFPQGPPGKNATDQRKAAMGELKYYLQQDSNPMRHLIELEQLRRIYKAGDADERRIIGPYLLRKAAGDLRRPGSTPNDRARDQKVIQDVQTEMSR